MKHPTRHQVIQDMIDNKDVKGLLAMLEPHACACGGMVDGEPECRCKMNSKQLDTLYQPALYQKGEVVLLEDVDWATKGSQWRPDCFNWFDTEPLNRKV